MQPALIEELRALLTQQIAELERQAGGQQARSEAVELEQATVGRLSRMDALQQQAMQDATQARVAHQLQRSRQALKHLDHDDFGLCSECDEPIASGRLKVDPAATLCIGCASALQPPAG
ncbi:MAG: TraR/DksA C4-type zinc finger protein [Halopseudomonas sp.]